MEQNFVYVLKKIDGECADGVSLVKNFEGRIISSEKEYTKAEYIRKLSGSRILIQPSADGGKNSFCDIQEDYNDFIKNVYEPLREKDPNYIKREIIGKDSSNQYNIYGYRCSTGP